MATLKGQNFRILVEDSGEWKVLGMSTNCTVTLTGNTDESSTKDDVAAASKPTITSKSWSVSVDTLNIADAGTMLSAVKAMTKFHIIWDEVATTDNQTAQYATFQRGGYAFINDLTLTFNDRETCAKNIQLTGSGPVARLDASPTTDVISLGSYVKGQYVRLFLGSNNSAVPSKVIGAAKQLSFHTSMSLESASTKDTQGDWDIQEPTSLSFDISFGALMRSDDVIASAVTAQDMAAIEAIYEASEPVKFEIAHTSGDNQRTKGDVIVSGSVVVTNLTLNGPNRQNADYSGTANGYGIYYVGAAPTNSNI